MASTPSTTVLKCNNLACRTCLYEGTMWTTACSHIFCDPCGSSMSSSLACIVCTSDLSGRYMLTKKPIAPGVAWKSMVLTGLMPDTIMDICSSAIQFYHNQTRQEVAYLEERNARVMGRVDNVKEYYEGVIKQFKKELAEAEAKLSEAQAKNNPSGAYGQGTRSEMASFIEFTEGRARQMAVSQAGHMIGNIVGGSGGPSRVILNSEGESPASSEWGAGSKELNSSWELRNSFGSGDNSVFDDGTSSFNWIPEEGALGGAGEGGAGPVFFTGPEAPPRYKLVKAEFREQNKLKVDGEEVAFMERTSVVENANNLPRTPRSASHSYSQLPLLLGKFVNKRGPKPVKSATRLGSSKSLSFSQLVPYRNRRF